MNSKDNCGRGFLSVFFSVLVLTLCGFPYAAHSADVNKSSGQKLYVNSIGIEFVKIPAGRFVMGEASRQECTACNASYDEMPRHNVSITGSFYMSRYEITQKQWLEIMDSNPSRFRGADRPVEYVSWNNVQLFIYALNAREKREAYRLPTEAEWEYTARAGGQNAYCFGDNASGLGKYGWYVVNSGSKSQPVGRLKPNSWGLYDMHGNVFEWCSDWFDGTYYSTSPAVNPEGPSTGLRKVRRGGSWGSSARRCRSSDRDSFSPDRPSPNTGFRLVMER